MRDRILQEANQIDTGRVQEGIIFDPRDIIPAYKDHKVRQDPLYICDLTKPMGMQLVTAHCYAIDRQTLYRYRKSDHSIDDAVKLMKAHHTYFVRHDHFTHPSTVLAKAAHHIYKESHKSDKILKTDTYPALFTSIVHDGVDTFSHKQCRVISERLPASTDVEYTKNHKHPTYRIGHLTGVNIGMDSFLPLRTYIPIKSTLQQLKAQNADLISMYRGW